jgi:hypothetical protein
VFHDHPKPSPNPKIAQKLEHDFCDSMMVMIEDAVAYQFTNHNNPTTNNPTTHKSTI